MSWWFRAPTTKIILAFYLKPAVTTAGYFYGLKKGYKLWQRAQVTLNYAEIKIIEV
jgi:hypothetical protein